MTARRGIVTLYAAGVAQGTALVAFPAVSTIITSPGGYGLSSTEYGAMFVPQVVCAIAASLLAAELTSRAGAKRIYLCGLLADCVSMALLFGSRFVAADRALAYPVLLVATASLGIGFGLAVPALNTLVAALSSGDEDRAILTLNALLGVGTVLAPALVALFVGLHVWYVLPLLAAAAALVLVVVSLRLPLAARARPAARRAGAFPPRFWLYAAAALLYGVVETLNGNWAEIAMAALRAPVALASLALTAFWAAVTLGRLAFAGLASRLPERDTYRVLPFVAAAAFVLIARLPVGAGTLGVAAFALAGLGCSALLPLTISLAQRELRPLGSAVAGGLIAFYQAGYGIAAFGAGPLQRALGITLPAVFASAACVAVALGLLAVVLVHLPRLERIKG